MVTQPLGIPLRFRLLNYTGGVLRTLKVPLARLDEDSLHEAAMKATRLANFGDSYYREGLRQLLESAEQDAHLHFIGRLGIHTITTESLKNRLRLVEIRRHRPEIFQRPLVPPIIVMGLPRSGTTLLHRLLAADPSGRALPLWETMHPFPDEHSPDAGVQQRRRAAERNIRMQVQLIPDLDRIHYVRADIPEECIFLFNLTFVSMCYWMVAPVYGYLDWYLAQDRTLAYREYAQLLQILQSIDPARRLVLKAPAHTGSLDALLQAIPNAMVIQIHRNPVKVMGSLNSLLKTVYRTATEKLDVKAMAAANLHLAQQEIERNLTARKHYPGAVYDVHYDQLVADPVNTVRAIYRHFKLPWTESYEQQFYAYLQQNPKEKHGRHRYHPADFSQSEAAIAERLSFYIEHFRLEGLAQ